MKKVKFNYFTLNDATNIFHGENNLIVTDYRTNERLYWGTLRNIPEELFEKSVVEVVLIPQTYLGIEFIVV